MKSLNIGVIAYGVDPSMVFVRVPNERGRWMLVDRSVVEVDCPHCKAVAGEPCRRAWPEWRRIETPPPAPEAIRYHVAVHVKRKQAWAEQTGHRFPGRRAAPHKLRITAAELAELQQPAPDVELVEIEPAAIAKVKKAAPMIGMWVEAEAAANGGKIHPVTSREVERVLWEANTRIEVTPR